MGPIRGDTADRNIVMEGSETDSQPRRMNGAVGQGRSIEGRVPGSGAPSTWVELEKDRVWLKNLRKAECAEADGGQTTWGCVEDFTFVLRGTGNQPGVQ